MAGPTRESVKARSELQEQEHDAQLAWIDWVQANSRFKSDNALMVAVGMAGNLLPRFRKNPTAILKGITIRLISEATGLPGPDRYLLPGEISLREEGERFDPSTARDGLTAQMVALALKGRPNAAPWRLRTHALELAGYLPGDIVISDNAVRPLAGQAVIAQHYDLRGGAETIFRLFEPPYLIAVTNVPELRKPLLIDDQRVIVMGTITQSFRFPN